MFGSVKMDNKVEGNKPIDNKDPQNKSKLTHGQTQKGAVSPKSGNTKIRVQNSGDNTSPEGGNTQAITKAAGYSKKPTAGRQTVYSDGAMAVAKRARGML